MRLHVLRHKGDVDCIPKGADDMPRQKERGWLIEERKRHSQKKRKSQLRTRLEE